MAFDIFIRDWGAQPRAGRRRPSSVHVILRDDERHGTRSCVSIADLTFHTAALVFVVLSHWSHCKAQNLTLSRSSSSKDDAGGSACICSGEESLTMTRDELDAHYEAIGAAKTLRRQLERTQLPKARVFVMINHIIGCQKRRRTRQTRPHLPHLPDDVMKVIFEKVMT
jgi:hypothetical protein